MKDYTSPSFATPKGKLDPQVKEKEESFQKSSFGGF